MSRSHPLGCSVGAPVPAGQLTSRPPSCRPEGVGAGSVSGSLFDSFQESHSGSILGPFWVPFWVHFEARIKVETKREPARSIQTAKEDTEAGKGKKKTRTASHRIPSRIVAPQRDATQPVALLEVASHRIASHATQRSAPRRLPEHCESGISESG